MRILPLLLLATCLLPSAVMETIPEPPFFFYEENAGQSDDPEALLLVRGGPHRAYLTLRALHLFSSQIGAQTAFRLTAPDASPTLRPLDAWPGRVNRFSGPESAWRRSIPAHRRVQLSGVYPGVDLILGEVDAQIALTYVIRPGADLSLVSMQAGSSHSRLEEGGKWLVQSLSFGAWRFGAPAGYQGTPDERSPVDAAFALGDDNLVGFSVGAYDTALPLYLETVIEGRGAEVFQATAIDDNGVTYRAGSVLSSVACSVAPGGTINFCPDAYVAAYDADGIPLFHTILAGAAEDVGWGVHPDGAGGVSFVGGSYSADFPVTADAFQTINAGPIGPKPRNLARSYGDLVLARLDAMTGSCSTPPSTAVRAARTAGPQPAPKGSCRYSPIRKT